MQKQGEARTQNGLGLRLSKRKPADDTFVGVSQCLDKVSFSKKAIQSIKNFERVALRAVDAAEKITSRIIKALNRGRRVFPPLKKLLFEAFWFVFAAIEIVRFLGSLL